jgi:hypothetical protein
MLKQWLFVISKAAEISVRDAESFGLAFKKRNTLIDFESAGTFSRSGFCSVLTSYGI